MLRCSMRVVVGKREREWNDKRFFYSSINVSEENLQPFNLWIFNNIVRSGRSLPPSPPVCHHAWEKNFKKILRTRLLLLFFFLGARPSRPIWRRKRVRGWWEEEEESFGASPQPHFKRSVAVILVQREKETFEILRCIIILDFLFWNKATP